MAYGTKVRDWADPDHETEDVLFRVDAVSYAGHDPYATPYGGEDYVTDPVLEVTCYVVRRWTPTGATLEMWSGARRKHVDLRPDAKQWASRTVRQAVEQFRRRRDRQIYILDRQLARAKYERDLAISACNPADPLAELLGQ